MRLLALQCTQVFDLRSNLHRANSVPDELSNSASSVAHLPPVIRVAIIEDQEDIREGLWFLINTTDGFRCNGCFGSVEEALPKITANPPDVVLVDIGLPGM